MAVQPEDSSSSELPADVAFIAAAVAAEVVAVSNAHSAVESAENGTAAMQLDGKSTGAADQSDDDSSGDEADPLADVRAEIADWEDAADDEDDTGTDGAPRTRNEIDAPVESLKPDAIDLAAAQLEKVGEVMAVMQSDRTVIVKGAVGVKPLEEGSVLCATTGSDETLLLGKVYEVFGPVTMPHYVVKLTDQQTQLLGVLEPGHKVQSVASLSKYLRPESLISKGCDASNVDDEEPTKPDEMEYSDDEQEAAARAQYKAQKRGRTADRQSSADNMGHDQAEGTEHSTDRPARGRGRGRGVRSEGRGGRGRGAGRGRHQQQQQEQHAPPPFHQPQGPGMWHQGHAPVPPPPYFSGLPHPHFHPHLQQQHLAPPPPFLNPSHHPQNGTSSSSQYPGPAPPVLYTPAGQHTSMPQISQQQQQQYAFVPPTAPPSKAPAAASFAQFIPIQGLQYYAQLAQQQQSGGSTTTAAASVPTGQPNTAPGSTPYHQFGLVPPKQ